jgi:hypothetical protein
MRLTALLAVLSLPCCQAVGAQRLTTPAPPSPGTDVSTAIAQARTAPPLSGVIPTDVTPSGLGRERELVTPGLTFRIFQKMPAKLWFQSTTEVSQRFESNVLFTSRHGRGDYVFRALPNVTLGYNVFGNTSIYCNYFVIKDVYARQGNELTFPTTQSLALGLRQSLPLGRRTNLQLDFQARELWQTSHLHQADLIPGITLTHVLRPDAVVFANVQLQMRGREYFVAPTRELDPFYSVGAVYRRGQWTFSVADTFVTNFRSPPFHGSIPPQSNMAMIADFEVARTINRRIPGLQAFLRAEPIWNFASQRTPGLSGYDFRLFSGLRLSFGKPSLASAVTTLRQQLLESEGLEETDTP